VNPPAVLAIVAGVAATCLPHGLEAVEPVAERYAFEAHHMGTTARVVVCAADRGEAEAGAGAALSRIGELDARLSDYRADSEISLLAERAGGPAVTVSPDLFTVLSRAQDVARRSDGAFDVTVGPLSRLWRRARRTAELPTPDELQAARALVGYGGLTLDQPASRVRLAHAGMRLDLGGIAKGYAADEALRVLRRRGLACALVVLGGEVAAGAAPPGQEGWTVALRTPGEDQAPLSLHDAAASTSGDAEQWVEIDGRRYSHIFDPRTGQALTGRHSVTVVAREGVLADALATALSVLGPEKGLALVNTYGGVGALWVEAGAAPTESPAWSALARIPEARRVTP
jgi:FAD:protein FMN transferase